MDLLTGVTVTAAAALVLSACSRGPDLDAARAAIRDADIAFAAATKARGADGWVSFFADSGMQVAPGQKIVGKAAIREAAAVSFGDTSRSLSWQPTEAHVSAAADLGYTVGRYESTARLKDSTVVRRGTYVTIWRKLADGSWKVVLDTGSPDPTPAPVKK